MSAARNTAVTIASLEIARGSPTSPTSPPAAPRRAAGRSNSRIVVVRAMWSRAKSIHGAKLIPMTSPRCTDCPLMNPVYENVERAEEGGDRGAALLSQKDVEPEAADDADGDDVDLPGSDPG